MMGWGYYDRSGREITVEQASLLRNQEIDGKAYMTVAREAVPGTAAEVSTVWLALDHRHGEGAPLIFETMVFGGGLDQECERWATEDEAHAGHEAMVERVRFEADTFRSIVVDPAVRSAALALRDARKTYRETVGGYELDEKDYGRIIAAIEADEAKP